MGIEAHEEAALVAMPEAGSCCLPHGTSHWDLLPADGLPTARRGAKERMLGCEEPGARRQPRKHKWGTKRYAL